MKKREAGQGIKTFIAEEVSIKGEIKSQGSIRIDGFLDGHLDVKGDLYIGNTGDVKGEVRADNVFVGGKVEGNIHASGKVDISSSGQVFGDVKCSIITIDEGGIMEGTTSMAKNKIKADDERRDKKAVIEHPKNVKAKA